MAWRVKIILFYTYNFIHCYFIYISGISRPIFSNLGTDKHKPDIETLNNYAITKRWDSILNFMAGVKLKDYNDNIGETTKKVIYHAGLVEPDNQDILITASGFQFLLMDIFSQIWYFLRKYLEVTKDFELDNIECLSFIFELNFLTFGKVFYFSFKFFLFNFYYHLLRVILPKD